MNAEWAYLDEFAERRTMNITDLIPPGERAVHVGVTGQRLTEVVGSIPGVFVSDDADCGAVWGEPRTDECPHHAIAWCGAQDEQKVVDALTAAGLTCVVTDGIDFSEDVVTHGEDDVACHPCPAGAH